MKILGFGILKSQTRQLSSLMEPKHRYDAIIVGGGHNGLVSAAYLARGGKKVAVFERRHVVGGAAVTEEIVPGFKFSRASYLLGLFRPQIYDELNLKKFGLQVKARNPNSFTPIHEAYWTDKYKTSLTLGGGPEQNRREISKFSEKDAQNLPKYEAYLRQFVDALTPLLDGPPIDIRGTSNRKLTKKVQEVSGIVKTAAQIGKDFPELYKLMTAPTTKILEEWFESEPLKATLATDSVIGSFVGPSSPGSGYVLLHHLMGEVDGVKEAWGFPIGGMGAVSKAIADSALNEGAHIFTDQEVEEILVGKGSVEGIRLANGSHIASPIVLSNATPKITFLDLLPSGTLPPDFEQQIRQIDYSSPVCKINVALKELPSFKCVPNVKPGQALPHHQTTIHLNCESLHQLDLAYQQGKAGQISHKPVIEMTIPSSVDPTLAPEGCHVALFFTQYVPYTLEGGRQWDEELKKEYAEKIFKTVDEYAPGFRNSVVGYEVLPPPDLERIFGLTGGNIFHGSMSLDQLYFCRPAVAHPSPSTPIKGLYMCGAGAHPGGGVMGASGKLAAMAAL